MPLPGEIDIGVVIRIVDPLSTKRRLLRFRELPDLVRDVGKFDEARHRDVVDASVDVFWTETDPILIRHQQLPQPRILRLRAGQRTDRVVPDRSPVLEAGEVAGADDLDAQFAAHVAQVARQRKRLPLVRIAEDGAAPLHGKRHIGFGAAVAIHDPHRAGISRPRLEWRVGSRSDQEIRHVPAATDRLIAIEEGRDFAFERTADAASRAHRAADHVQRQVVRAEISQRSEDPELIDRGAPLFNVGHFDERHVDVDE